MRAFIGIDFEKELKNEIYELQQNLKRYAKKGRWKHIDNFHLTLKFLSDISLTQQAQIDDAMKKLCINRKPFSIALTGLETFDGKDSIRVLWMGITGDTQELQLLHKEIDKALTPIGFQSEKRKFKPHITIGQDIVFECGIDQIRDTIGKLELGFTKVDSLFLFKSEQVQNKRVYTKVNEYDFYREYK
jgi:RNA 2',3'-cyclic 3'-phosphodiesterase